MYKQQSNTPTGFCEECGRLYSQCNCVVIYARNVITSFRKLQKSGSIEDKIYFEAALTSLEKAVQND